SADLFACAFLANSATKTSSTSPASRSPITSDSLAKVWARGSEVQNLGTRGTPASDLHLLRGGVSYARSEVLWASAFIGGRGGQAHAVLSLLRPPPVPRAPLLVTLDEAFGE